MSNPEQENNYQTYGKGHRYDKNGWTYVHIEGEPLERGEQYGYLIRDKYEKILNITKKMTYHLDGIPYDYLVKKAVELTKDKITEDNIRGAPGLIFEVVSPSTEVKDRREKKDLYERFGVEEYIIVFPEREYMERYCLKEGKYGASEIFNWDEVLSPCSFEIEINLREIFEKEKPEHSEEIMED